MNLSRISKTVAVAVGVRVAQLMNNHKLQRRAGELECDLAKLARGSGGDEPLETREGQIVALRIKALETRIEYVRKLNVQLSTQLLAEQGKIRRLFAPMKFTANGRDPFQALCNLAKDPFLDNASRGALHELADRLEASEKEIHTEGSTETPAGASADPLPLSGRAVEAPPSGVIVGSYDTGVDKWVHGERNHEGRRFLGPCPACGRRTTEHTIQCQPHTWRCTDQKCEMSPLAFRITPKWWNSDIAVIKDGNMWRANRASFVNIQESPSEFGMSPGRAVAFLLASEMAIARYRLVQP